MLPDTQPYFSLADLLYQKQITEANLPERVSPLPPLTEHLLDELSLAAVQSGLSRPRYGWAVTAVSVAAAQLTDSPHLQALAAWNLAHAANAWYRPQCVATAIKRARAIFQANDEPGWIAACDWQANAIPWMQPNFSQATAVLESALAALQTSALTTFVPHCRLSLAYAYVLVGRFEEAFTQVAQAETTFAHEQDTVGQAQCLYTRAAIQRRSSQGMLAITTLEQAQGLLPPEKAPVFAAIVSYNKAYLERANGRFNTAEAMFKEALHEFEQLDLSLWHAQCQGALAQLYNYAGRPVQARQFLQEASVVYADHHLPGLLADNLLDQGQLEAFCSNFRASRAHFRQAQTLYSTTGNQWMAHVALMDVGYSYYQEGAYQQALRDLELAYDHMKQQPIAYRLANCTRNLGEVWMRLGNMEEASRYVDETITLYQQSGRQERLSHLYLMQAEICQHNNDLQGAFDWLQQAYNLSLEQGIMPLVAQAELLLGEHLLLRSQWDAAVAYLETAVHHFQQMKMPAEQAATALSLGRAYAAKGLLPAAKTTWQQALNVVDAPHIIWQAHAELAQHTQAQHALCHYREGMATLARLRRNVWQPALTDSYLAHTAAHMDKAVNLAFQTDSHRDAQEFIAESKAQTVAKRLAKAAQIIPALPEEIQNWVLEIRWLQNQLTQLQEGTTLTRFSAPSLQTDLAQKVRQYHTALARLERAAAPDAANLWWQTFSAAHFRQLAAEHLGETWLALDYYLTEDDVYCVILTPTETHLHTAHMTAQVHQALRLCVRHRCQQPRSKQALGLLGELLLPQWLWQRLTPDTRLIVAPHRQLHGLPWAGLFDDERGRWLVETAVPTIIPSLHSLVYLWQRQPEPDANNGDGLMLMVSEFATRHLPLPAVTLEQKLLHQTLNGKVHTLANTAATVDNLLQEQPNFADYAFLHVASHAFVDKLTGRLSGIALYDRDLWLDEWQRLAPLPPLVTFSACSGLQSRLYEGDEAQGLAISCLAAGAQQVVGNLWPLLDTAVPHFMQSFYAHWQAGASPAAALAMAQRSAIPQIALNLWAGYQCFGVG